MSSSLSRSITANPSTRGCFRLLPSAISTCSSSSSSSSSSRQQQEIRQERRKEQQQQQQPYHEMEQQQKRVYHHHQYHYVDHGHRYSKIQLKLFSSSSSSGGSSNGSSNNNRRNRSGPVVLSRTPRSAKRRQISLNSDKINNNNNREEREDSNNKQHTSTHFIKGGTPCDPIPPQEFRLDHYGENSLYTLILLRHGESEWNALNNYTGWCDVQLTERGVEEAEVAGRLLAQYDIQLDHAFTSYLQRANRTLNIALHKAGQHWVPITKTWRLNERHYGALQGYNKDTSYKDLNLDQELVMQMRRSYDVRPPRMENDHPYWHGNDRRYQRLSPSQLELTRAESLKDTADRTLPFYRSVVIPSLKAGNKCLIVSHANTIRTLIKHIDQISDEDIKGMSIPTGLPLLYRLDKDMKPVDPTNIELEFRYMIQPKGYTWATDHAHGFHGVYLGDIERLQDIQSKRDATNRKWQRIILQKCTQDLFHKRGDGNIHRNRKINEALARQQPPRQQPDDDNMAVADTRQIWFRINQKIENNKEYNNMLLLTKMRDEIEHLLYSRRRKHLTLTLYKRLLEKISTDTQGQVVEPFLDLTDREYRNQKQQVWYDNNVDYFGSMGELEEECLIK